MYEMRNEASISTQGGGKMSLAELTGVESLLRETHSTSEKAQPKDEHCAEGIKQA